MLGMRPFAGIGQASASCLTSDVSTCPNRRSIHSIHYTLVYMSKTWSDFEDSVAALSQAWHTSYLLPPPALQWGTCLAQSKPVVEASGRCMSLLEMAQHGTAWHSLQQGLPGRLQWHLCFDTGWKLNDSRRFDDFDGICYFPDWIEKEATAGTPGKK